MKAILLYNLYPKNTWKSITNNLLSNVPHDKVVVHVTMPVYAWFYLPYIKNYLRRFNKVEEVLFSYNRKRNGETTGFNKFRKEISFEGYDIITYVHSKGTSRKRKNTKPIQDWTEMMRYFVIERLDLCKNAFKEGFYLYGVDLSNNLTEKGRIEFPETKFIYEGNFVSLNNNALSKQFLETECKKHYYGVERFWGTLCEKEKAYCIHYSKTDHYNQPYPSSKYVIA
jgi:hypothetical protein